jgi:uncharacterized membrane protein/preprotein translocase subunit SecE
MKPFIEIKKQRNIDAIIEDSFKFFRLHIKEMLKIVWEQNRILLTLLVIVYFLNTYYSFDIFTQLQQMKNGEANPAGAQNSALSGLISIVFGLLSIIFFPRFFAAIAGYMQLYDKNKGQVNPDEVKQIVKDKFWGLIGLSFTLGIILVLIILFAAFLFTGLAMLGAAGVFLIIAIVIPLIMYAVVYLSLVFYVYFFENVDMGVAISRTATYIKERFWFSFGVIFIMTLIVMFIASAVNAPIYIYLILKGVAIFGDNNAMAPGGQSGDIFISLYSIVSYLAQLVLRVLTMISLVFLFFSLKEYHTNESMFEKIDQIGNDDTNSEI